MEYRMRRTVLIILILALRTAGPIHAQGETPAREAEAIRQALFNAQSALMNGDREAAVQSVQAALDRYQTALAEPLAAVNPDTAAALDRGFEDALSAAENGDSLALSAARAGVWTGLLDGAADVTLQALNAGDTRAGQAWLLLREFRSATRFSRPGADGTLAVQNLIDGKVDTAEALQAVQIDLLDTYQAQLNSALANADQASARAFTMRQAEEVGLAAGYFAILSDAYGEQRGEAERVAAQAAFNELVSTVIKGDAAGYAAARAVVDEILTGFRAAPLSEAEQARRAGQLLRFVALVPVEYERGVRDGKVVADIEIQEALTFREGAAAAFADLSAVLHTIDPAATARVGDLLDTALAKIQSVASPDDLKATVGEINSTLSTLLPAEWQNSNADSDIDVILSVLDQVDMAAAQGQYALAESARLEAYALLELGMEQRLRGFAPDMAVRIESLFWQGNEQAQGLSVLLATQAPIGEVRQTMNELRIAFAEAAELLSAAKAAPAAVAGNAAVIVFREGLEAVLILASLLASLRAVEERRFRRPLIVGAALAFLATVITWWLATQLLSSLMQYGEKLEAVVSLIAIGVLLLITNWFFHKVYWTGWMANFHTRKRRLIGGIAVVTISQSVGLIILGFSSIYREGFETVLFLQSLVLEAGSNVVLQGVALGLLGTAIVGVITFALQVRLPYKKMLIVTGVMIGGVLLVMVGNTVHVMQSVGWLTITPIQGLNLPYWTGQWFGLFATWQGIGLQIIAAVFVIGSYFWAERINHRNRNQAARPRPAAQAETTLKATSGD
jgi:high-affinity iron transporter